MYDNIFADDDALDFIIYEEFEKQDQKQKSYFIKDSHVNI
jgi:hypothetical protein